MILSRSEFDKIIKRVTKDAESKWREISYANDMPCRLIVRLFVKENGDILDWIECEYKHSPFIGIPNEYDDAIMIDLLYDEFSSLDNSEWFVEQNNCYSEEELEDIVDGIIRSNPLILMDPDDIWEEYCSIVHG